MFWLIRELDYVLIFKYIFTESASKKGVLTPKK